MVLARFVLNAARGVALDKVVNKLWSSYEGLRRNEPKHLGTIGDYPVDGRNYFGKGSVDEIAQTHGFGDYRGRMLERVRAYTAELGHLVDYMRQNPPSLDNILNIYAHLNRSYEVMSKLLGSKLEPPKGYAYLSDMVNDYTLRIGDLNNKFRRIVDILSGFDASGDGLAKAAAKWAAKGVTYKLLDKIGLPATSINIVVNALAHPFAETRKAAKQKLASYAEIVKGWGAYLSDISPGFYQNAAA